jgi:hypothetical protein
VNVSQAGPLELMEAQQVVLVVPPRVLEGGWCHWYSRGHESRLRDHCLCGRHYRPSAASVDDAEPLAA